ncbi:integrase, catalytic region, zinc finger, CCHC-type containing protein [Tanacetum coccineum]
MTGQRDKLFSFVSKFIDTVRCGNDHFAAIMSYGDLQFGNVLITRVYYVEGLDHNLFLVGQFYASDLEVAFRKHTCFVCNLDGVVLLSGSRGSNLYTISLKDMMKSSPISYTYDVGIHHQTSVAKTSQQNGVIERGNRTLVEAARSMLIFSKSLLFLWAEAVVTACYTQNRSLIHTYYNKTPYKLLRDRKPDVKLLYVFGALCYPTNDSKDLRKLQPKADIGIFIGYSPSKKAFRIYNKRTQMIMETIHVQFDDLTQMASEQYSSGPELQPLTSG